MIKKISSLAAVGLLAASISPVMAGGKPKDDSGSSMSMTGNIGIHSKYVLRGITGDAESDTPALQGGLDLEKGSFYFGWWFSSLDYTYLNGSQTESGRRGVENDFYGGWKKKFGKFGVDVGLIQYYYVDVDDSDLTELKLAVSYGPFKAQLQYLLTDGYWGNTGDQYYTFQYDVKLPKKFALNLNLGHYVYDDDDNSELSGTTSEDSAFRHFNITLSRPIGNSGANMYAQYIVAGKDRGGNEQEDTMVFGITYSFDVK